MSILDEMNIDSSICKAIDELGYQQLTPIQEKSIPVILEGKDVLGKSQTGTGKTAAFGIPCIERVSSGKKLPQAMIIAPTRELVLQIASELRKFCKYKEGVKIIPIYGGEPINRQIQLLSRGCGIVVGTPGRILDHMRRHTLKLRECHMVILDEADEMLNMGFQEDIETILEGVSHAHQTILFSATMPKDILQIAKRFQNQPVHIEVAAKQATIHTVEQVYYEVPRGKKSDALVVLLQHFAPNRSIIFCNTKKQVDELCESLGTHEIAALGLHGDMKQEIRTRVMNQYRSGAFSILVATDVAARGIDVDDIELVVNFDIPQDNEYYIHRVGRSGRAGKSGKAVTLITSKKQEKELASIMKMTKTNIRKCTLPTTASLIKASRNAFIKQVKEACSEGITAESMEIANRLMAEGIAIENLISALITMNYKPRIIELETGEGKRRLQDYETAVLRFDVGKKQGIQAGNLVCAIVEYCDISSDVIGRIDVRSNFSLVAVAKEYAPMIVETMMNCVIAKKRASVCLDEKPKAKKQTQHRRGSARNEKTKRDRNKRRKRVK